MSSVHPQRGTKAVSDICTRTTQRSGVSPRVKARGPPHGQRVRRTSSTVVVYSSTVLHRTPWAAARAGLSKHVDRVMGGMDVVVVAV